MIAGRSAYFLQAFINIGLIPDAGATWLLPRLAGRARAMEMMMLGERIPAEKARAMGPDQPDGRGRRAAGRGARRWRRSSPPARPRAYGLLRRLARDAEQSSLTEALAAERIAQRDAGRTKDFKRGVMAFLPKQQPRFDGD